MPSQELGKNPSRQKSYAKENDDNDSKGFQGILLNLGRPAAGVAACIGWTKPNAV